MRNDDVLSMLVCICGAGSHTPAAGASWRLLVVQTKVLVSGSSRSRTVGLCHL